MNKLKILLFPLYVILFFLLFALLGKDRMEKLGDWIMEDL